MGWIKISGAQTVEPGSMKQLSSAEGGDVLVLNGGGTYFACQAICPHLDTPLEEGMFDGETLTCHQHLWQWDVASGDPKGLAEMPLACYRTKVESGELFIWRDD